MRWAQQLPLQKMASWNWLGVWWEGYLNWLVVFQSTQLLHSSNMALSGNAFKRAARISPLEPSLSAASVRRVCFRWVWVLFFAQFPFPLISTLSTNRLFVPKSPSLVLESLNCISRELCVKQFPVMVEGQKVSLLCAQYAEHFSLLQIYAFLAG